MSRRRNRDPFPALDRLRAIFTRVEGDRASLAECAAALTVLGELRTIDYLNPPDQRKYERLLDEMQPLVELWSES